MDLERLDREAAQRAAREFSAGCRLMYWLGISPAGLSQAMIEELFQSKEDAALGIAAAVEQQWAYWSEQDRAWKPTDDHLVTRWENVKD